jgi:hypothetical protein
LQGSKVSEAIACPLNEANKKYKEISEFNPEMEHYAMDDARCQGIAYVKMKRLLLI